MLLFWNACHMHGSVSAQVRVIGFQNKHLKHVYTKVCLFFFLLLKETFTICHLNVWSISAMKFSILITIMVNIGCNWWFTSLDLISSRWGSSAAATQRPSVPRTAGPSFPSPSESAYGLLPVPPFEAEEEKKTHTGRAESGECSYASDELSYLGWRRM